MPAVACWTCADVVGGFAGRPRRGRRRRCAPRPRGSRGPGRRWTRRTREPAAASWTRTRPRPGAGARPRRLGRSPGDPSGSRGAGFRPDPRPLRIGGATAGAGVRRRRGRSGRRVRGPRGRVPAAPPAAGSPCPASSEAITRPRAHLSVSSNFAGLTRRAGVTTRRRQPRSTGHSRAVRGTRAADRRAELHHRLVERRRAAAWEQLVGARSDVDIALAAGEHAAHIGVHGGHVPIPRERGNRSRGVLPTPGSSVRSDGQPCSATCARGALQRQRAAVVAEPGPQRQHVAVGATASARASGTRRASARSTGRPAVPGSAGASPRETSSAYGSRVSRHGSGLRTSSYHSSSAPTSTHGP